MSLTAQNVVDQVSIDMRKVLANSGNDAAILLNYVDRIHKDCLHNSVYASSNRAVASFSTVNGQSSYALGVNPRRILEVVNRSTSKMLMPLHQPEAEKQRQEEDAELDQMDPQRVMNARLAYAGSTPHFYMTVGSNLYVFPTPGSTVFNIDVYYEQLVSTVASLSTTLTIPEDGLDMLVAGVNYLTAMYLKRENEAQFWVAAYEKLKKGEVVL